jgi:hypothetical protein
MSVTLLLRPTCFTPFCFNAPCQYTPPLNTRPLILSLKTSGWLGSITLTLTYYMISFGNTVLALCLFYVHSFPEEK